MTEVNLTWEDLGVLKDALNEFKKSMEDIGIDASEVSWNTDGSIYGELAYGTIKLIVSAENDGKGFSYRYE